MNTSLWSIGKRWHEKQFHGAWKRGSDGGCMNEGRESFLTNPQYTFVVPDNADNNDETVIVALMQKDQRGTGGENYSIGFALYKVEVNREAVKITQTDGKRESSYANYREIVESYELAAGRYVVVPSSFKKGVHTEYLLRIFSESSSHARELTKTKPDNISSRRGGVLRIDVHSATGLPKVDLTGPGADPYVEVKVDGHKSKTHVVYKSVTPSWHSAHVFYLSSPDDAVVKLSCYDHDTFSRNDFIGSAHVDVKDFAGADKAGSQWQLELPLRNEKSEKRSDGGTLTIKIRWDNGFDRV